MFTDLGSTFYFYWGRETFIAGLTMMKLLQWLLRSLFLFFASSEILIDLWIRLVMQQALPVLLSLPLVILAAMVHRSALCTLRLCSRLR